MKEGMPREVPGCGGATLAALAALGALVWRWLR